MGTYDPLRDYLLGQSALDCMLLFLVIERIVGSLPTSTLRPSMVGHEPFSDPLRPALPVLGSSPVAET